MEAIPLRTSEREDSNLKSIPLSAYSTVTLTSTEMIFVHFVDEIPSFVDELLFCSVSAIQ